MATESANEFCRGNDRTEISVAKIIKNFAIFTRGKHILSSFLICPKMSIKKSKEWVRGLSATQPPYPNWLRPVALRPNLSISLPFRFYPKINKDFLEELDLGRIIKDYLAIAFIFFDYAIDPYCLMLEIGIRRARSHFGEIP